MYTYVNAFLPCYINIIIYIVIINIKILHKKAHLFITTYLRTRSLTGSIHLLQNNIHNLSYLFHRLKQ